VGVGVVVLGFCGSSFSFSLCSFCIVLVYLGAPHTFYII